jgi:Fe-S-cluster containining protein
VSISIPKVSELSVQAEKMKGQNKTFLQKLKKKPPPKLDEVVQSLHDDIFSEYDCLSCANCCKSLGPRITDRDVERLAKYLKTKPSDFTEKYLRVDEDNDYVFKSMPCPFLQPDNYCSVYSERPKACREYPHTDRKKFYQLLDITYKNTFTCPTVFAIVEELKRLKI